MPKLSIIIPSRDERFLIPTIDDIFRNARCDDTEVVAVLDSDKWPDEWKEVTDRHPRLHTIHNGKSIGMRGSINKGVGSAISRGAKYIMKSDGHCSFSEGFDEILKAECEPNWVVVPRRGRLDPENWVATETHKPDIDYHYLSFPDDPNDFGGPGLNGKVWNERVVERKDILLDEEMSSQGSCWFMHTDYFRELELMDQANYGPFWNEFQEIGLKCWLSGGRVMVNKKCKYLHLHKGKTYGRGYHLPESWLQQGRSHANLWAFNEAWPKQTLPFSWLIEHFWPVPTWPENWEQVLYATRKPKTIKSYKTEAVVSTDAVDTAGDLPTLPTGLVIHSAVYGISGDLHGQSIDVADRLRELVKDDSLDIVVNNSTLTPNQNPFRGKKKRLLVRYSFDSGEVVDIARDEKDWLIIGPVQQETDRFAGAVAVTAIENRHTAVENVSLAALIETDPTVQEFSGYGNAGNIPLVTSLSQLPPMTAPALNDYLIRKFSISPQRLRGPMPIELRDFHRNDLAELFAELGFKRGAEIGVAEGNYSEVLLKANPECELLLVDPWHAYAGNPQNKSNDKHEFAYNEVVRKTKDYPHVDIRQGYSMDVVDGIVLGELDFVYVDACHLFDDCVMDIIEWSKRVRSGGIVSGDDYYALDQKRWVGGGVVEAVQAYTNAHRIPIWYIFQGHKSTDFMWVKP